MKEYMEDDKLIVVSYNKDSIQSIVGLLKNAKVVLNKDSLEIRLINDKVVLKDGEALGIDNNGNYYVLDTDTEEIKYSFYAEDVVGLDESLPIYIV